MSPEVFHPLPARACLSSINEVDGCKPLSCKCGQPFEAVQVLNVSMQHSCIKMKVSERPGGSYHALA
jgi:hypothetical protein